MASNALSGKAGASVGKPRVARGGGWSVHSVGNEHGTPFIENRECSWGAGRMLCRYGEKGIGIMGCVLLDSGYVFFHNLDAVFFAALEIARFVLGGRNEKS